MDMTAMVNSGMALAKARHGWSEHQGRITAYAADLGFFAHAVAENNEGLKALIGAASSFPGGGFFVPSVIGPLGAHRHGCSGMRDHKSRRGTAHLEQSEIALGTGILGPEPKGRNCRISANGDRNPSERR